MGVIATPPVFADAAAQGGFGQIQRRFLWDFVVLALKATGFAKVIQPMPTSPRAKALLAQLAPTGYARIETLARKLEVTEETIRRTARRLEAAGLVTKTHGAVHLREAGAEPNFSQRMQQHPEAKRRIARAVAGLIPDGASLFLDVGSTTAYVAQALQARRDLMVVTNSLAAASALTGRGGNRVFMAGGELRTHDGGAFGAEALHFVRQFRVGHAILSAAAIDAEAGFLLQDLREAEFSRAIIACAETATIVADASKFGLKAPIQIAEPSAFTRLVTDAAPPAAIAERLAAAGVAVQLA
jgi:DeoR family glycerol-3-phosphate regulon repressor